MLEKTRTLQKLLLWCWLLLLMACLQEECPQPQGTASLQFSVKSIEGRNLSRGVNDLNDDGIVSDEELYTDGQKMYRLGIFLLEGTKVVASTVLNADDTRFNNSNTEATVSFTNLDYSKTYQLYAVANYGNHGTLIGNVSDVNASNLTSGLKVNASSDNICPKNTVYPLTLKQGVKLNPGANTISGQLVRTYARLRINVRNQSDVKDLKITKLQFQKKFTQSNVDLFSEGGTASMSPIATSESAINPFEPNTIIPMIDVSAVANERTIFDAYILESTGGDYKYTLGLSYAGERGTSDYYIEGEPLTIKEQIEDNGLYVMRFIYPNPYHLYADEDVVRASENYETDGKIDPRYVWRFKKVSGQKDAYTIESLGASGGYMKASTFLSYSSLQLANSPTYSDYFTIANSTNSYYGNNLQAKAPTEYYIYVNGPYVLGATSGFYSYFRLLKVKQGFTATAITHEETIPIKVLDNKGQNLPITAIHRNDFIEILVSVTYNEKTGNIEYEVSDWNKVNGEVTFD